MKTMIQASQDIALKAPFPWFGGKSRVAHLVWERFGDVPNYVEPFFGSGAVLLGRPTAPRIETVNDLDGFVANAWRAIASDPEQTARWADWPSNENDLHARHVWLKDRREELSMRLEGDPDYCDFKIAGWWLWGMSQWIGGGFCGDSGGGPWAVVDGKLIHLGDAGQGVSRKLIHLGDAGRGVSRGLIHLGNAGRGVSKNSCSLLEWFSDLQNRLRRVRVSCGDWSRVCGGSVTFKHGVTGVFLDPPYSDDAARTMGLYAKDCGSVAHEVRRWCIENQDNPLLRIALCGYEGEHDLPGWTEVAWKANGGYGNRSYGVGRENSTRERIWFSPHCLNPSKGQQMLF